jgi:hypothetical protein
MTRWVAAAVVINVSYEARGLSPLCPLPGRRVQARNPTTFESS